MRSNQFGVGYKHSTGYKIE